MGNLKKEDILLVIIFFVVTFLLATGKLGNVLEFSLEMFIIVGWIFIALYWLIRKYIKGRGKGVAKYLFSKRRKNISEPINVPNIQKVNDQIKKMEKKLEPLENRYKTRLRLKYIYLLLSKADILVLSGEMEKARLLLEKIDKEWIDTKNKVTKIQTQQVRATYYSIMINVLIYDDKQEEASELFEEGKALFQKDEMFYKTINAILIFHRGDFSSSKKIFEDIIKNDFRSFLLAECNYYLGIIAINEKDIDRAKEYLNKGKEFSGNTFLLGKIQEQLEKI